ncbi:MAG: glutaminyl-tRNA synthase (glutamine-hydrolyzing) subunit B [Acidobacteria bacterium RIFCSPLOWO2_02_FULL_65_29]|nr:MAG: glutaminyl-tRNA synthase (glutamine-hydrolyzing) subunit B [Acidobacteria bacterium RIFCSPLOWO2_02_FULL_65_29]
MTCEAVIGLEIHAQLRTASKIFCGCSTAFGAPPNTHVCPVCLGFPGALPVLNRSAVDFGIRAALALGCRVNPTSIFARKNYFYPDLPKGYQISQYERPLAERGLIEANADYWGPERDIRITRVHLEEDAGKLLHEGFADSERRSYVDLNRAGTPLVEIVTEPDLRQAKEAASFFGYLRELLMAMDVNDGNMEEGSLRCDANVSIRQLSSESLGVKVEVKNLNSFRFLERALDYEIERQAEMLRRGEPILQETRLWDSDSDTTVSMRSKEHAHDYRYFPEPDLPPLVLDDARVKEIREAMPEAPAAKRRRLEKMYGLARLDVVNLTIEPGLDGYFEEMVRHQANPREAKNWVLGAVRAKINEARVGVAQMRSALSPAALASLLALVEKGAISGAMAKGVFETMFQSGRSADDIVRDEGLAQIDDDAQIAELIAGVLAENGDAVAQYHAGKAATFGFLVGQVMKATRGKANPKRVNDLLRKRLDADR